MTDLTAAQVVEKLREYSDSDDHPINLAATLIEQQNFLLAAMHEDRMRASLLIDLKANEVAALRKVIEDAIAAHKAGPGGFDKAHVGALAVYNILAKALPAQITT
jgi:hypothetical protein